MDSPHRQPQTYRLRWDDVVYEPGNLKVVTYKAGRRWATEQVQTAGDPARIRLDATRTKILSDGQDLAFVTVTVTDTHGGVAPRADNHIRFSIDGPAEIVATSNGNPTNLDAFPSQARHAFNGRCLVIVRAERNAKGRITLHAQADALRAARLTLRCHPVP